MFNIGDIITFKLKNGIKVTGQVKMLLGKETLNKKTGKVSMPAMLVETTGLMENTLHRVAHKDAVFLKAGDYEIKSN